MQRHARQLPTLRPGTDSHLPLRGEQLPLHWQAGRSRQLRRDGEHLVFQVLAADMTAVATDQACIDTQAGRAARDPDPLPAPLRRVLRDFYLAEARADVGRWLPKYLPDLPRPPLRIGFKAMRSQWGSLSARGVMALDLSLVLAPSAAFEYVLVHELCHLLHHDHSPAFWQAVGARFPEWRAQHDWFQAGGRGLKVQLQGLLVGEA